MSYHPLMKIDEPWVMSEIEEEPNERRNGLRDIRGRDDNLMNQITPNTMIVTASSHEEPFEMISDSSVPQNSFNFPQLTSVQNQLTTLSENFDALSARGGILHYINAFTVSKHEKILSDIVEKLRTLSEIIQVPKTTKNNLKNWKVSNYTTEKETILLLGGDDGTKLLDSLLVFQSNGEYWKKLTTKLPSPIIRHGVKFLKNYLYIFGGESINNEILNSTYRLSKTLKWEKMRDMNDKRSVISNSNVILNDQIYVLGGKNLNSVLNSAQIYNPVTNNWKYIKEMNECRSSAAADVVNGKIFCSGGHNGKTYLNSIECYDPSSDTWTLIYQMPKPVAGHGIVGMNGHLIMMGGYNNEGELNNVWSLDTLDKNATWIEKPSMSALCCAFNMTKIGGKIVVCGGVSDSWVISKVEIFNGEIWTEGPRLTVDLCHAAATVIPMDFANV